MVYYFSGTGNSRYVACRIAALTGDRALDIADAPADAGGGNRALLGIVFPVYGWRLPKIVRRFCGTLDSEAAGGRFVYAVLTCGTDTGKAFRLLRRLLRERGMRTDSAYSVIMPDVYVCLPGFDVDKDGLRKSKYDRAARRILGIADDINARRRRIDVFEGAFPRIKTYLLGTLFFRFLVKDAPFNASAGCDGCGACRLACPVGNIAFEDGRPSWRGKCEGCLNCYHSCPRHAINFGRSTLRKGQYTFLRHACEMRESMGAAARQAEPGRG